MPASEPRRRPYNAWYYWRDLLPRRFRSGHSARVVALSAASEGSVTLQLQPAKPLAPWRAGQHLAVATEIDGARVQRHYTLHSLPGELPLRITVKRMPGGRMGGRLGTGLRVGDWLDIEPPWGGLSTPEEDAPVLWLAAGSGITAAYAALRAAQAGGRLDRMRLLYSVRRRGEAAFLDECRELVRRHPGFGFRLLLTGEAPEAPDERAGRISAAALADLCPDPGDLHVRACGPQGFITAARGFLEGRATSFEAESFAPPVPVGVTGGEVSIALTASGRTLRVPAGAPLLEALEAAGLAPRYGCRRGLCQTCVCEKTAGTHIDLLERRTDTEPSSALKICVSAALSDLRLNL